MSKSGYSVTDAELARHLVELGEIIIYRSSLYYFLHMLLLASMNTHTHIQTLTRSHLGVALLFFSICHRRKLWQFIKTAIVICFISSDECKINFSMKWNWKAACITFIEAHKINTRIFTCNVWVVKVAGK